MTVEGKILALSGGVGGAKLSLGLAQLLPAGQFTIVANTGDDFEHLGLHIAPDLDTVMYTLAGLSNQAQGWGLEGESWQCLQALQTLGGETWFQLGDRDIATHLLRSQRLREGATLTTATDQLCTGLGIGHRLLPMSDDPVRTIVHTEQGPLPFQHYFVRERCEPVVTGFEFAGISEARPQAEFLALLADPSLTAVVVCPSNPFVSIDPMLALPGLRQALVASSAQILAVSPIVAGTALKGPAAKMMKELQLPVSALAVAEHYRGLIDCFVVDTSDATLEAEWDFPDMQLVSTNTVMKTLEDRVQLASFVLEQVASR